MKIYPPNRTRNQILSQIKKETAKLEAYTEKLKFPALHYL